MNGFNVGRYWPTAGPQVTLYVPAGLLRASPRLNHVVVLELEKCPSCSAQPHSARKPDALQQSFDVEKVLKFENVIPSEAKTRNAAAMFEPSTADLTLNVVSFVDKPVINGKCFNI